MTSDVEGLPPPLLTSAFPGALGARNHNRWRWRPPRLTTAVASEWDPSACTSLVRMCRRWMHALPSPSHCTHCGLPSRLTPEFHPTTGFPAPWCSCIPSAHEACVTPLRADNAALRKAGRRPVLNRRMMHDVSCLRWVSIRRSREAARSSTPVTTMGGGVVQHPRYGLEAGDNATTTSEDQLCCARTTSPRRASHLRMLNVVTTSL